MSEEIAAEIRGTRFTPVRLTTGYAMHGVDDLLDVLEAAARQGQPLAPLVDAARLQSVRFREGYDQQEVDALLERLGRSTSTGAAGTAPPATSVIEESRGLLLRLLRRQTR